MKPQLFSRKTRQFITACRELETQINSGNSDITVHSLVLKVKRLAKELAHAFNWGFVKRTMGSAAFLFGMVFTQQANAQNFLAPLEDPFSLESINNYAPLPVLADLDGDGDFDLLTFEYYGSPYYYENIGSSTAPVFASPIQNPFGLADEQYAFPAFADIDNDGDLDLFIGEYYANLGFFENIGSANSPEFATKVINPFGFTAEPQASAIAPAFADLDMDGDLDLIGGHVGYDDDDVRFFRNEGTPTQAVFGDPLANPFGFSSDISPVLPQLIDLDMDGDLDLMQGNYFGSFIYQENVGTPSEPIMSTSVLNPFNLVNTYDLSAIAFADLDGDGDIDFLVGQYEEYIEGGGYSGSFQYFENAPELSVGEVSELVKVSVFPNPSSDFITVKSSETISQIEVIDLLGRTSALISNVTGSIDVSQLDAGNYMIKVTLRSGETGVTKFIKQ